MQAESKKDFSGFSDFERAAMKERAKELLNEAKRAKKSEEGEADVLAAIAAMPAPDKALAELLHAIVKKEAPSLMPKTWYGMPAYADAEGNTVCFFQAAEKFKARYATLGFNDRAKLDEGAMWPTSYALNELNAEVEKKIAELVKKAVS